MLNKKFDDFLRDITECIVNSTDIDATERNDSAQLQVNLAVSVPLDAAITSLRIIDPLAADIDAIIQLLNDVKKSKNADKLTKKADNNLKEENKQAVKETPTNESTIPIINNPNDPRESMPDNIIKTARKIAKELGRDGEPVSIDDVADELDRRYIIPNTYVKWHSYVFSEPCWLRLGRVTAAGKYVGRRKVNLWRLRSSHLNSAPGGMKTPLDPSSLISKLNGKKTAPGTVCGACINPNSTTVNKNNVKKATLVTLIEDLIRIERDAHGPVKLQVFVSKSLYPEIAALVNKGMTDNSNDIYIAGAKVMAAPPGTAGITIVMVDPEDKSNKHEQLSFLYQ